MTQYIFAAGEDMASKSSDITSDGHNSRHHLLHHKLNLDEETTSDKAAAQSKVGKQESKKRANSKHMSCKHISESYTPDVSEQVIPTLL